MKENKDKIIQYICNLIIEYWEEKKEIPNESRKIILGWLGYVETKANQDIAYIADNIEKFLNYEFPTISVFKSFIYNEVFNSAQFKIMCDELRGKKRS